MKKYSLIILFSVFVTNILAQEQDSIVKIELSLSQAIERGLEKNYQMIISRKNVEIAENNNTWGAAGRLPSISFGISQGNRFDNSANNNPLSTDERMNTLSHSITPNANLRWTIFGGFAIQVTKSNLSLAQQMAEEGLAVRVENTVQQIALAYYSVLLENEKLDVMTEVLKLSSDRYYYMMQKKELGTAVTFEVLQVKNNFLSDSSNYLLQRVNYENSLRTLALSMGDSASVSYVLTDDVLIVDKEYLVNDLQTKMFSNNKTLRNQYINIKMSENAIKMNKSGWYPTLALNAGTDYVNSFYSIDGGDYASGYSYDAYANLSLTYTLYSGGARKRNIQNAKIEQEISQLQIDEMKLSLTNQLLSINELYNIRKQMFQVAEENLESAKLNLQIAEHKFKNGSINSFNYRDIQMVYLNVAFSRLQTIYNLISTHTDLLRLTGGIVNEY